MDVFDKNVYEQKFEYPPKIFDPVSPLADFEGLLRPPERVIDTRQSSDLGVYDLQAPDEGSYLFGPDEPRVVFDFMCREERLEPSVRREDTRDWGISPAAPQIPTHEDSSYILTNYTEKEKNYKSDLSPLPDHLISDWYGDQSSGRPLTLQDLKLWDKNHVDTTQADASLLRTAGDIVRRLSPEGSNLVAGQELGTLGLLSNMPLASDRLKVSGSLDEIIAVGRAIEYLRGRHAGPEQQ